MTVRPDPNGSTALSTPGGEFAALLGELDMMKAQAMPPGKGGDDDAERVQAAAADADNDGQDDEDKDGEGEGEGEGEGAPFGKSFQVTMPDGTIQEAYDGTAMMKALHDEVQRLGGDLSGQVDAFTKALGTMTDIIKGQAATIAAQGTMLKSLRADVAKFGGQGAGRKAVVNVHDKPAATGAAPASDDASPDMVKSWALDAQLAGKITGFDVARIAVRVDNGEKLDPATLAAIRPAA
ncbi:hypothetical protein UFOVP326_25 [uncultured Caudovirales phage]|uniref:Uncharacterized protein n=1 Tax=uncultured Caudovirales phage TaxID=2100421 RepID=A0A6J5LUA9_9CAUD|nr:hypothetical protein UFOVP326_25 [uncultured Caudovirales phage]